MFDIGLGESHFPNELGFDTTSPPISNSFEWTTSKTEDLIKQYKNLRELWDVTCPAYRNRWKKRKAWKILAEQLGTEEFEIRRKMHNLRSQFSQEIRKKRSSWHFFHSIEFLKDVSINIHKNTHSRTLDSVPALQQNENNCSYPDSISSDSQYDSDQLWSQKKTIELIDGYKSFPELWNKADPSYRDKQKRKEAIESLAGIFEVSIQEVQRKIHNLRSQYCQEMKKSSKNIYESSWCYLPFLKFLDQDFQIEGQQLSVDNSDNTYNNLLRHLESINPNQNGIQNACTSPSLIADIEKKHNVVINEELPKEKIVAASNPLFFRSNTSPSSCYNWTMELSTELIRTFQSMPELWDCNSPDYRNRVKKKRSFELIARRFCVNEEELQRKLHNLRSQFNQEYKKVHTKPNFQSSWCFYAPMLFLKQKKNNQIENPCASKEIGPNSSESFQNESEQFRCDDEDSNESLFYDNCLEPIVDVYTVGDQSNVDDWLSVRNLSAECKNSQSSQSGRGEPSGISSFSNDSDSNESRSEGEISKGFWTFSRTKELIEIYQLLPELWDISCVAYRNRLKRRKAWQKLASHFTVSKGEVQRKMHNLRSQFSQELRREGASRHVSSWIFYEPLNFLKKSPHRTCSRSQR